MFLADVVEPDAEQEPGLRDAADQQVLATLRASHADYLITGTRIYWRSPGSTRCYVCCVLGAAWVRKYKDEFLVWDRLKPSTLWMEGKSGHA